MKNCFTIRALLSSGLALSLCAFAMSSANAQHDGFGTVAGQYTVGALDTPSPTLDGFTDPWTNASNAEVVATGLNYDDDNYFIEIGGCVNVPNTPSNNGRQGRLLSSPLVSSSNAVFYLSFLMQTGTDNVGSYRALELHDGGFLDGAHRKFQVGFQNSDFASAGMNYGFNASGSGGVGATSLGANDTLANLFVVKFDLSAAAGGDSVTVWHNPDLTLGEDPAGGITESGLDITFDRITLAKYGDSDGASWDEIRFGSSFTKVTNRSSVFVGDINCSGNITFLDIPVFIDLLSAGGYADGNNYCPDGYIAEADCNQDGEVNFSDISPFIEILSGQ